MSLIIYEINTWIWLSELSRKYQRRITLANVPPQEWDGLANLHVNAVWLMGVWTRSIEARKISASDPSLQQGYRIDLPDIQPEDISGSPYSIANYVVDSCFGGTTALATARSELKKRGLKLILDYVPNHVAPDHPWTKDHPEFFIQGNVQEMQSRPEDFFNISGKILAKGRDPYFPPWPDTLQLNVFHLGFRKKALETVTQIASQCDGVRCDMAMLVLNDVFARTWGRSTGPAPNEEFWTPVIGATKQQQPEFIFIAEVYWDLEWRLQQLGFDYCYDKRLYDRLRYGDADGIRAHLKADLSYQNKLLRFLENHDETRAAAAFDSGRHRAAAVTIATLPGAQLYHEGQLSGRKYRTSVHLGRRAEETVNEAILAFYTRLLSSTAQIFADAKWQLCECGPSVENGGSFGHVLAWTWSSSTKRFLIAVNFRGEPSRAAIHLFGQDFSAANYELFDILAEKGWEPVETWSQDGLRVQLEPWEYYVFQIRAR